MFGKDMKWFPQWNKDNPTDIYGPIFLIGAAGAAVLAAAVIIMFGNPIQTVTTQTGPRGNAMGVVDYAGAAPDPSIETYVTSAPVVPASGDALAKDAIEGAEPALGDLTVANYERMVDSIRSWTGIPDLFAGEENYQTLVARNMIEMTQNLNENWGDHVGPSGVNCMTCHRGEPVPSGIWFNVQPVNEHVSGWSANQNRATDQSQSTSLPSDALEQYLLNYEAIRVHDLEPRVENDGTATIQMTERTYSLMNYFSNSLDVNCTFCHNTRAFYDLDQSTPQLEQSQLGIAMVQEINNDYMLPIEELFPQERLGSIHMDVPKVGCLTCHKGYSKPMDGTDMISDWPELASTEGPTYE